MGLPPVLWRVWHEIDNSATCQTEPFHTFADNNGLVANVAKYLSGQPVIGIGSCTLLWIRGRILAFHVGCPASLVTQVF